MRKATSLLALFVLSLSFVSLTAEGSGSQQLIQDPQFNAGGYEGKYDMEYWNTASYSKYHRISWNLYVSTSHQWAVIDTHTHTRPPQPSYAYFWQTIKMPSDYSSITKATLTMKFEFNFPEEQTYAVLGILRGIDGGEYGEYPEWLQVGKFPRTYNHWYVVSIDVTNSVKYSAVVVAFGVYVPGNGYAVDGGYFYADWVYLNVTFGGGSGGSSGGGSGWSGGGSGWYGGGSSWHGGGSWWSGGSSWFGSGGLWFGKGGGNQTYVEFVAANIQRVIAIIGTGLIAVLWVKVGTDYFSRDSDKRMMVRDDTLLAIVGTLIIALAVLGAIWMIAGWVVGASESIMGVVI